MSLDDVLSSAAVDLFSQLPTGTFTPSGGGESVSVHIRHRSGVRLQQEGDEAVAVAEFDTIDLLNSELPRAPARGDIIILGNNTYTVQIKIKDDGYISKVAV